MAKHSTLTFGTKAKFTPTRGTRIAEIVKQDANLLTSDQRRLLGDMAKRIIRGTAYGKAHANRR